MSDDPASAPAHDTLIIKRGGGGHHDEHHGGVWKIAFADFMTAMMAFFLVMWLISANDKTKAVIAKYFNPIELVDSTPQPRGLADPKKDDPNIEHKPDAADAKDDSAKEAPGAKEPTHGAEGKHGKEDREASKAESAPASAAPHPDAPPLDDADHSPSHAEVELIRDPYAVLAEIAQKSVDPPKLAAEKSPKASDGGHGEGGKGAVGAAGGEAFRDPFQPQAVAAGRDPFAIPADRSEPQAAGLEATMRETDKSAAEAAASKLAAEAAKGNGAKPAADPAPAAAGQAGTPDHAPPRDPGHDAAEPPAPAAGASPAAVPEAPVKPLAPAALRNEIAAAARALDPSPTHAAVPGVEVRRTDEGLLISLTDSANYAMFPSASARPSARSVALMATVGKLLGNQKGAVVVRGFTDSRPFRSDVYDNWRLSSERAHIAQYMLMRGGLSEARIDRVEGYADRHPRNAKDPNAPENRRIEILLRETAP